MNSGFLHKQSGLDKGALGPYNYDDIYIKMMHHITDRLMNSNFQKYAQSPDVNVIN